MPSCSSVRFSSSLSSGKPTTKAGFVLLMARPRWFRDAVSELPFVCLRFFEGGARSSFSAVAFDLDPRPSIVAQGVRLWQRPFRQEVIQACSLFRVGLGCSNSASGSGRLGTGASRFRPDFRSLAGTPSSFESS